MRFFRLHHPPGAVRPVDLRVVRDRSAWGFALLCILLAFAFLGSRGLWDPDEGRYANVALNMLDSGDWLNPKRSGDVGHWTKPPLTYWAIAASVGVFGKTAAAARLPAALSYLLCIWLTWRIGRRLAPGCERTAALAYATMLLPFGASQMVTTDFLLAAFETLAVWAFVEARMSGRHPGAWGGLMWVGFALAFLTKGPPGLLPLPVLLAFDWLVWRRHPGFRLWGLSLFCLLALPWFVAVVADNPGLLEYFVGDEVVNRVVTDKFGRHEQWYGWLLVYAPTLVVGTMPWSPALWRWLRALPADLQRWRSVEGRQADPAALFLALWVLLPLLVFCLAQSRLPLYLLPLFVPLALLVAVQRRKEHRSLPRWPWLAAWVVVLLALKLAASFWPTHKDASQWAVAIHERAPGPVHEVIFVEDMTRYGLRLHLDAEIEKIGLDPVPAGARARFNPVDDEDLATELAEAADQPGAVWICKQSRWPGIRLRIAALGFVATPLGTPYRGRVIFRTRPVAALSGPVAGQDRH
ncbi:glycosyltransferase family 39 protein [Luteimonas sp. MC1572]|uniref:ArnT family glycosyltransferase n=1 Tax=Luteimonas sp. MC1572 TaxID=2799325 RepID=UPI0018F0CA77|nr:glycosyltransferase family 39 protein [Luteimonas sp. MC1572]MBJ6980948.1 glycosyltransferase family 39 protein [Luteimonas sp. MC1572]QQO02302.1 glycosyltransferase family 39 protein [Luteimonas sp. MC1572]